MGFSNKIENHEHMLALYYMLLQLFSHPSVAMRETGEGGWRVRSRLDFGTNNCLTRLSDLCVIWLSPQSLSLPPCTRALGTLVHLVTSPVLTLFALLLSVIKPTVLLLNILVATITTFQFFRAGHFSWRLFWPFALLSVPCAFLGGYMLIPAHTFKLVVGCVLLFSAMRLFWSNKRGKSIGG